MKNRMAFAVIVAIGTGLAAGGALADEEKDRKDHAGHDHGKGDKDDHEAAEVHGGEVIEAGGYHFEVVFGEKTLRVYALGTKNDPLHSDGMGGSVQLVKKKGDKPSTHALKPVEADPKKGTARDYLEAAIDLTGLEKGAKVVIKVTGLPDAKAKEASFTVTFEKLSPRVEYVCAKKCEGGKAEDPGKCAKCKGDLAKTGGDAHDHKK